MVRKYTELTEYIYAPDMPVAPGMEACEADRKAGLKLFDGFDFIFTDGAFVVLTCSSQTVSLPLRLSLLPVSTVAGALLDHHAHLLAFVPLLVLLSPLLSMLFCVSNASAGTFR